MQTEAQISVPKGSAIAVDGKIDADEWKDAANRDLAGGGKMFLKHDGNALLVGVQGKAKGWAQIYVTGEGTQDIIVHHAPAAIDRLTYRNSNGLWQPAGVWKWEMRDRGFTPEIASKLSEYWKAHRWVANNSNMNSRNEVEFMIKTGPDIGSLDTFYIAVEYVTDDSNQFFPANLSDATVKSRLAQGGFADPDLRFDIKQWAKITLKK